MILLGDGMDDDDEDFVPYDYSIGQDLVGKKYIFADGDTIEIIQVKRREYGPAVTYHVTQGPGIPRKMILDLEDFMAKYGHLFK
jgi:hypothetical protein